MYSHTRNAFIKNTRVLTYCFQSLGEKSKYIPGLTPEYISTSPWLQLCANYTHRTHHYTRFMRCCCRRDVTDVRPTRRHTPIGLMLLPLLVACLVVPRPSRRPWWCAARSKCSSSQRRQLQFRAIHSARRATRLDRIQLVCVDRHVWSPVLHQIITISLPNTKSNAPVRGLKVLIIA